MVKSIERKPQKIVSSGLKRIVGMGTDVWLASYVDDHLIKTREHRIDEGWFHPSELHMPCDRRLAFSYLGVPKRGSAISAKLLRIFHNGDWVHRRWQSYFRAMGILVKREAKFEVANPPVRGSADAIIRHPVSGDKSIVEIKSINDNGFSRLNAPRDDHFNQLNIYMAGHKILQGLVLYENKNDQNVKIYPVKFDSTRWEQLQFRLLKIMHKLAKDELPDVYEHPGCPDCPFFYGCYQAGNVASEIMERM